MNKLEKYLLKQIEEKDIMIDHLHEIIERIQHYQQQYFKEQRFLDIVSEKAKIKSFESSDGTIKRYIQLGDINDYGCEKGDFDLAVRLLNIGQYEDPEGNIHDFEKECECECCSECDCEDCFDCEKGGE